MYERRAYGKMEKNGGRVVISQPTPVKRKCKWMVL
jgi:hypothetical protein